MNMEPNPRILKAVDAMKDIGISEDKTNSVLKKLLKLYNKNWVLIEEENYRVLADTIFEEEDRKVIEEKKCQSAGVEDVLPPDEPEPERPRKKLCLRGQETQVDGMVLKKPKLEEDGFPETCLQQQMQLTVPKRSDTDPSSSRRIDKGKESVSSRMVAIVQKQEAAELGVENSKVRASGDHALIKPKDEPFMDDAITNELPITAIDPGKGVKMSYVYSDVNNSTGVNSSNDDFQRMYVDLTFSDDEDFEDIDGNTSTQSTIVPDTAEGNLSNSEDKDEDEDEEETGPRYTRMDGEHEPELDTRPNKQVRPVVVGEKPTIFYANKKLQPSGKVSRVFYDVLKLNPQVENKWIRVPDIAKQLWFDNWKAYFEIPTSMEPNLFARWESHVRKRYSDIHHKLLKDKSKKPNWLTTQQFEAAKKNKESEEQRKISEIKRANRLSNPSLHTGGSRPHYEHAVQMSKDLQRPVTPAELHLRTHTKKKDKSFVDEVARKRAEKYEELCAARFPDPEIQPTQEQALQMWLEAVGGKKSDGSVPGLGSWGQVMYADVPGSSRSARFLAEQNDFLRQQITAQQRQMEERLQQQQVDLEARVQAQIVKQLEVFFSKFQPSNV